MLRYRYPGEAWQEVKGDKYTFEEIQPYEWWYFYCDATSMSNPEGCGSPVVLMSKGRLFGRLIEANVIIPVDSFGGYVQFDALIEDRYGRQYRQVIHVTYSPSLGTTSNAIVRLASECQNRVLYVRPGSFGSVYAADRWRNTNPNNNNECRFTVFSGQQIIFQRTQWGCPEVELIETEDELVQCPEGTCQVDCGSVYCCYGSDGYAVDSFSK